MLKLKLGSKGEIVIPKKIRESLGLAKEKEVILEVKDRSIIIKVPPQDIVKLCEERAKRYNIDLKKMVYGDRLYEEVFSRDLS